MRRLAPRRRGGRPVKQTRYWNSGTGSYAGPLSMAIEQLTRNPTWPVAIFTTRDARRRDRASIVTTARRRGLKVRTKWNGMGTPFETLGQLEVTLR